MFPPSNFLCVDHVVLAVRPNEADVNNREFNSYKMQLQSVSSVAAIQRSTGRPSGSSGAVSRAATPLASSGSSRRDHGSKRCGSWT
jgi:hypothetical protein